MTLVPNSSCIGKNIYNGPIPINEVDRSIDSGIARGTSRYYNNENAVIPEESPIIDRPAYYGNRNFDIDTGFGINNIESTPTSVSKDLNSGDLVRVLNESRKLNQTGTSEQIELAADSVLDPDRARESYRRKGKSGLVRQECYTPRYRIDNGKLKVKRAENGKWLFVTRPSDADLALARQQGCDISTIDEQFLSPAVQGAIVSGGVFGAGLAGVIKGYNTDVGRVIAVIIIVIVLIIAAVWVGRYWYSKNINDKNTNYFAGGADDFLIESLLDEYKNGMRGGRVDLFCPFKKLDSITTDNIDFDMDMTGGAKPTPKKETKPAPKKETKPPTKIKTETKTEVKRAKLI